MKNFMFLVIMVLAFAAGWFTTDLVRDAIQRENRIEQALADVQKTNLDVEDGIDEIYRLIASNNSTQSNILDHHGRLLHYVAGHDFRNFVHGCPECGLLEQLNKRKSELSDRIQELSEWLEKNKEDPKFEDKKAKLIGLHVELNLVSGHIYNADDRAKKIGELMMKRIQEENKKKAEENTGT
jgi:hypothetical protein